MRGWTLYIVGRSIWDRMIKTSQIYSPYERLSAKLCRGWKPRKSPLIAHLNWTHWSGCEMTGTQSNKTAHLKQTSQTMVWGLIRLANVQLCNWIRRVKRATFRRGRVMSRQNNTTQCKVGRRLDWTEKEDDDNSKPLDCLLKCPSKVEQKPAKSCCNAAFDQAKSHDRVAQQASRILSVTHTAEKKNCAYFRFVKFAKNLLWFDVCTMSMRRLIDTSRAYSFVASPDNEGCDGSVPAACYPTR